MTELPTKPVGMPFLAPCATLAARAPFNWLRLGWQDLRAAPLQSLFYGVLLAAFGAGLAWVSLQLGLVALYVGLASGFVFIGPVLAMGLYSISYQLENHRTPTLGYSLREGRAHVSDTLVVGMCLLVVLLVWVRAATVLNVLRPDDAVPAWQDLIPFFAFGSAVGALFCLIVFCATAFSLPMLLDRRSDAITAVITSVNASLRNKPAMLLWATIIVSCVLIGFATFFVGFIVVIPLLGHATWHAYRETIDASAWPSSHEEALPTAQP
jgi:uncharacterized membrane protein